MSFHGTAIDATAIYTCPTGKKAVFTISCSLIAYGASGTVYLMVGGVSLLNWVSGINLTPGPVQTLTSQLEASQDLHVHGSVSDNATVNYTLQVLELPV